MPNDNLNSDLRDSQRDEERLKPDEATLDLPDVSDIPGQEHIHVAPLGELADTTASSDDEEGAGIFEDDPDDETIINMGTEADIPSDDKKMLERSEDYYPSEDEDRLNTATMDSTDFEGEPLNEESFGTNTSGSGLDTAGTEMDDASEEIGEEDEENNQWSLGSDRNDNMTEGTP
jgi:hypothetical protein